MKTNEEWVAEFEEIYGDYLEGYFCCSGGECACNGIEVDSEAYRWLRTLLTAKNKEKEEAVAEAYKRGYIQGGFDSEMNRLNVTPPTNQ